MATSTTGTLVDGQRQGTGRVVYANGDVYEGTFENDRRHGQGTFTGIDGYVYVGEWRDGRIEGQGQVTYPDGSVYVGAFRNDLAHGHGHDHLSRRLLLRGRLGRRRDRGHRRRALCQRARL
jgi:hypothetical protein